MHTAVVRGPCATGPGQTGHTTRGLGWGRGGRTLYVLTAAAGRGDGCSPNARGATVIGVIEVRTGQAQQVLTVEEARRQGAALPRISLRERPVTAP